MMIIYNKEMIENLEKKETQKNNSEKLSTEVQKRNFNRIRNYEKKL